MLSEIDDNDLTYLLLAPVSVIQQTITSLYAYQERKANEVALLRHALHHAGFCYTVLSHQGSHGISNQTARTDLPQRVGPGHWTGSGIQP